jgi:transcriptional regulator with XRE-family HTH domain
VARTDPTVRRRKLGLELRRLREAAGKTMVEVAAELNCSQAKISAIEAGHRHKVQPRDVRDMLAFYGVTDIDITVSLMELARQSAQKNWWHPYSSAVPNWFSTYISLEAEAQTIQTFEPHLIPGLLQTEEYAKVATSASLHIPTDSHNEVVELRKARQELLSSPDHLDFWAIIDELVLKRTASRPNVLRNQLMRLAEMAQQPNIHIQILPLSAGIQPGAANPFIVLTFPDDVHPGLVYLENEAGALYLEEPVEVTKYQRAFNHLTREALGIEASLDLMHTITEELP